MVPLASGTAGAAKKSKAKPPLYILADLALSGTLAQYGQVDLQGMQAQVNLINKAGGYHGRKITIVTRDDGSTASKAVIAAKTLLSSEPLKTVIFCYPGSVGVDTVASLPVFTATKCLTITPAATTGPTGDENFTKFPYTFMDYPDQSHQATPQVAGAAREAGKTKKVGFLVGTDVGDQAAVGPTTTAIQKLGLTDVATITVPTAGTTFVSQLATLKQDGATAVIIRINAPSAALTIMKGVAQLGWTTVKVVGGPTNANATVLGGIPAAQRSQFFAMGQRTYIEGYGKGTKTWKILFKAISALGTVANIGISADSADLVNIGWYAFTQAKSTTATKERKVLDSMGKKTFPPGYIRVIPQPHYTKKYQDLENATFKTFWGLLQAGTAVTDQWPGVYVKVTGNITVAKTIQATTTTAAPATTTTAAPTTTTTAAG